MTTEKDNLEVLKMNIIPLFNAAINFITERYGRDALDEFLRYAMGPGAEKMAFLLNEEGLSGLEANMVPMLRLLGMECRVAKSSEDELVVENSSCATKGVMVETDLPCTHYCRHCEVMLSMLSSPFAGKVEKKGECSCAWTFKKV